MRDDSHQPVRFQKDQGGILLPESLRSRNTGRFPYCAGAVLPVVYHSLYLCHHHRLFLGGQHPPDRLFLHAALLEHPGLHLHLQTGRCAVAELFQLLPDHDCRHRAERFPDCALCLSPLPQGLPLPRVLQLSQLLHDDLRRRPGADLRDLQERAGHE